MPIYLLGLRAARRLTGETTGATTTSRLTILSLGVASMRTDRTKTILPTPWIFLILAFLCCHMLSHPTPADLAQLPQGHARADLKLGLSKTKELPAFIGMQSSSPAILQKLEVPSPQMEAASPTALLLSHLAAPRVHAPDLLLLELTIQHTHIIRGVFPHCSRSPPLFA